jgi:hypothetical protein
VKNIISPLENICSIRQLSGNKYWLNFHLYFWDHFNYRSEEDLNNIRKEYNKLINSKYIQYENKIYFLEDSKIRKKIVNEVEKEVRFFEYDKKQHTDNVKNRLYLNKSLEDIGSILKHY